MSCSCRAAVDTTTAADLGVVSAAVVESPKALAAHTAMVECTATTDDLASSPAPNTAAQEVALKDGTGPIVAPDKEEVDPSAAVKAPLAESPAAVNQKSPVLRLEVASSSSSLRRAEQLSQAIIASSDKQAAELREALFNLSAAYKVIISLILSVPSPQGSRPSLT